MVAGTPVRRLFPNRRWKLGLIFVGSIVVVVLSRGLWIPAVGRTLICDEQRSAVDAILVDNLEINYLLFERAAMLQEAGVSSRVLVPTISPGPQSVAEGIVELMARVARLRNWEVVTLRDVEPISLNAALQVRNFLNTQKIRSVAVVTSGFRSRRTALAYQAAFALSGMSVSCVPVFGERDVSTWASTWHGRQEVVLQFLKLQYYRFYVLPKYAWEQ